VTAQRWGADTYELDRALSLARYREDAAAIRDIEARLMTARSLCAHEPNPEKPTQCYRCGADVGPAVRKVESYPALVLRVSGKR